MPRPKYTVTIKVGDITETYAFDVRAGSNKNDIKMHAYGLLFSHDWCITDAEITITPCAT